MGNDWTEQEKQYLIANYANTDTSTLAKKLNRSVGAIYNTAFLLKLKKNKKFIKETAKKNYAGHKTQFKKGHIPFNKNKKRSEYMSEESAEKCRKTQFKKGNIPHNHKPIGYERQTKDGYIEVKVEEPNVFKLKQRHIYEQKFGDIPDDYNVIFKDGNNRNFDIANLECISNAELMNRNTIHQYPPELQQTIKLNNKLIKLIKDEQTD